MADELLSSEPFSPRGPLQPSLDYLRISQKNLAMQIEEVPAKDETKERKKDKVRQMQIH